MLRKTCSDGDARTDSGRLFQTDAAATGKVRSPMVARTVRGATSAGVVEERSRRRNIHNKYNNSTEIKKTAYLPVSGCKCLHHIYNTSK